MRAVWSWMSLWLLPASRRSRAPKRSWPANWWPGGLSRSRREGGMGIKQAVQYELGRMTEYHQTNFGQDPDMEDFIRNHTQDEVIRDGLKTPADPPGDLRAFL